MTPATATATLADQLDKSPGDSKKYGMTKLGIYCILGVFAVSAILFTVNPTTAGQIVVLAQIVVGAIAGLVGIFCGAQASVDFRNSASLAAVVESSRKEETRTEDINIHEERLFKLDNLDPKDLDHEAFQ